MSPLRALVIVLSLLETGCMLAGGPQSSSAAVSPTVEWVRFEGDVVSEADGEVTLRDRTGATVVMAAQDVRNGPGGVELRMGGTIVAAMTSSLDASQPGPTRTSILRASSPEYSEGAAPASSPRPTPTSSFGCFGLYKYHCDDGTFAGFCTGLQQCGR